MNCVRTAAILLFSFAFVIYGQQSPLSLNQAVQQALQRYPAMRASLEQVSAAAGGIRLARTTYLPRADLLGQVNRATHNNVFGQLFPQSVIPSMSGPVLGTNSLDSIWGSAVGMLVTWEPFDFGLRGATVHSAAATRDQANAQVAVTKLQVSTAGADAFLTILAAQQTVIAARAAVDRARVLNQSVAVLVRNQLRPGADEARTRAELALAETQLIHAEQAVDVGKAALAQLLGIPSQSIAVQPGPLLQLPPEETLAAFDPARHPEAISQAQTVNVVRSRERILDRSYYPRFFLQASTFSRGTGIQGNGSAGGDWNGLAPDVKNWAVGMTVTFPIFDIASIHARKEIESHNERTETARYDQLVQDLNGAMDKARANLTAARRVAKTTPIELAAARTGEQQANARYRAGLADIVEVAEAQRILAQAEIDDALARLGVWRSLLDIAATSGDLQPFLAQVAK